MKELKLSKEAEAIWEKKRREPPKFPDAETIGYVEKVIAAKDLILDVIKKEGAIITKDSNGNVIDVMDEKAFLETFAFIERTMGYIKKLN